MYHSFLREKEDGTTGGYIESLKKKDFANAEEWDTYILNYRYASRLLARAALIHDNKEEESRIRNLAMAHINDNYTIVAKYLRLDGTKENFAMTKKVFRATTSTLKAWSEKYNYSNGSRSMKESSYAPLKKSIEKDMANIYIGQPRIGMNVTYNQDITDSLDKANKAKSDISPAAK